MCLGKIVSKANPPYCPSGAQGPRKNIAEGREEEICRNAIRRLLCFGINLTALLYECFGHFFHAFIESFLCFCIFPGFCGPEIFFKK
jgi:hypothetical protein